MVVDKKMAIIDLGSNSVRMIVMKIHEDGSYKMIAQAKETVRLSEGMGEKKTLKPRAIERTLHTLKLFKKIIEEHNVEEVFEIATAAVRSASNKEFFLNKVKMETGFNFTVISGEEEGYYDYLGVVNTINIENFLIVDTGGASTELVMVKNRKLKHVVSIPHGAVTLTEKFMSSGTIDIIKVEKFINKKLNEIDWLGKCERFPVVGLGGSIRTLSKIHRKGSEFPVDSLHNYAMSSDKVFDIYLKVVNTKTEERSNIPGISKERADIIAAGLVPLKILMKKLNSKRLIISGNGLRQGVFFKNYLSQYGKNSEVVGRIHSIESFGTVDGPGIRFVLFTQGCPLRCLYCHNRDTWDPKGGKEVTVDEIVEELKGYVEFIRASGGGITVTGGEPTLQPEFVTELFKRCRELGIHTALDTSGFVDVDKVKELLEFTDLVLLDIKQAIPEKHRELTGVGVKRIQAFAKYLSQQNIPVWIRYVLVPGYTDGDDDIAAAAEFIRELQNVKKVEVLPYHKMGEYKWEELDKGCALKDIEVPSLEKINRAKKRLENKG